MVLLGGRLRTSQERIPQCFWPATGRWRIRGKDNVWHQASLLITHLDLQKVYIDDESYHSGHGRAYDFYGINPDRGAVIIVRPDNCKNFFCKSCNILIRTQTSLKSLISKITMVSMISSRVSLSRNNELVLSPCIL